MSDACLVLASSVGLETRSRVLSPPHSCSPSADQPAVHEPLVKRSIHFNKNLQRSLLQQQEQEQHQLLPLQTQEVESSMSRSRSDRLSMVRTRSAPIIARDQAARPSPEGGVAAVDASA
mmetsp:Transcript_81150/g.206243  ORF Transcript_81150/g.206243 Transcript_81150/m.206243 type:complete len:119 (+) Transcript_81150:112-468(+)